MRNMRTTIGVMLTLFIGVCFGAQAKEPLPIDYWAIRHAVNNVEISPDGKHILVLKLESKEGDNVLEIYSIDDFSKPIKRVNADPMEIFNARWVSDNVISGSAWKFNRTKVKGPEDSAFDFLLYSYNLKKNKFRKLESEKKTRFSGGGFTILNVLPKEPDQILISTGARVGESTGRDPFAIVRPRNYYKYNVENGHKKLVYKGNEKYGNVQLDGKGNPRFAQGVNNDSHEFINYYRKPGESKWKEFGARLDGDDYDDLYSIIGGAEGIVGPKKDDPNTAIVIALNGNDKAGLWEYDLVNDKYGKLLYQSQDSDVTGVLNHSNTWGEGNDGDVPIVAAIYPGAKRERHWFDMTEKALYDQLEANIPNAHTVNITSRSRDGKTMIVQNRGPKDPGSFWLIKDGKMAKMGSRNPLLKSEDLADVEYIRYTSRDGMTIPAYVTKPKGEGPFPLVVMPHGGPHINEVISFDEWGQLLANNGYMVLQPQYRISTGWGKKHFDAGFGQHGLQMQDDKDDGAQYLVEQGLVDPNRMAMFGWSYGGYAALVAATRDPNLYQCVVAGAAVADAKKVYLKRSGGGSFKALDHWSRARGGFEGVNPIKEIEKMNVPVMMVHGDLDARVLYFNFKDYRKEAIRVAKERSARGGSGSCSGGLENSECTTTMYRGSSKLPDSVVPLITNGDGQKTYNGKIKFVTLKGADHFSITLMYRHQKKFYTEMLDFLENDCGPGGI